MYKRPPTVKNTPEERSLLAYFCDQDVKPLRPIQLRALSLRIRGRTLDQIAAELGISRDSVMRWERKPAWELAVAELRRHAIERTQQLFIDHAEAVGQAVIDTATTDHNTNAQRLALEGAGVVKSNQPGAQALPLARALAAIQVNVRVEQLTSVSAEVTDVIDCTPVEDQPTTSDAA